MLTKNVYILYPAGYHGNYLKWSIEVSDLDLRPNTPLNPVPKSESVQYGGTGTSHLNHRIPTHQGHQLHTIWSMLNKPQKPLIYLINSGHGRVSQGEITHFITTLLYSDPDGIVISIHDDNDPMVMSYGKINCITKWPTFIPAMLALNRQFVDAEKLHDDFDFQNCRHDQKFRNWMVRNDFIGSKAILDRDLLAQDLEGVAEWYRVRNSLQPHEVNEDTYISSVDPTNRVFEISCRDIATDPFPAWLQQVMEVARVSNNFDCGHVAEFHPEYTQVQPNLKWFDAMQRWDQTGELDPYLCSHSAIQAEVIKEIFARSNVTFASESEKLNWYGFYSPVRDPSWPSASLNPDDFWTLPGWIQQELKNDFGYQPKLAGPPNWAIKNLDWENMSLEEINQVYQQSKITPVAQLVDALSSEGSC